MAKLIIILLVLSTTSEILSQEDIIPETNKAEEEFVGYFVKRGDNIEALLGEQPAGWRTVGAKDWRSIWNAGWEPNSNTKFIPSWRINHFNRNCTASNDDTDYCFYNYTTSAITDQLYTFYKKSTINDEVTGIRQLYLSTAQISELDTLTQEIESFNFIDYMILLKCLLSVPDTITTKDFVVFYNILDKVLTHQESKYGNHMLQKKFHAILYALDEEIFLENSNLTVAIFRPFESDVIGIGLNKTVDGSLISFPILKNKNVDDFDLNNLVAGAYLNKGFAETLKETGEERNIRLVKTILLHDSKKYREFFELNGIKDILIGISIPGYCKQNNLAVLKYYIQSENSNAHNWIDFGVEYFDSLKYTGYECILSKMNYFGLKENGSEYFESTKGKYCMPLPITSNPENNWGMTPAGRNMFPKNICFDKNLNIPKLDCGYKAKISKNCKTNATCFNHPISYKSEELYQYIIECYLGVSNTECHKNTTLIEGDGLTYVDIELYFLVLYRLRWFSFPLDAEIDSLSDLLNKGLTLLQNQRMHQISITNTFLQQFLYITIQYKSLPMQIIKPKFIYLNIEPFIDDIYGLVVYKDDNKSFHDNNVKLITSKNITEDYTTNENVDIILHFQSEYIENERKSYDSSHYIYFNFNIFIIHNSDFEETGSIGRSKSVWINCNMLNSEKAEFNLHFKTDDIINGGKLYTKNLKVNDHIKMTAFVSEESALNITEIKILKFGSQYWDDENCY